jgi:hypothetical protein
MHHADAYALLLLERLQGVLKQAILASEDVDEISAHELGRSVFKFAAAEGHAN